MSRRLHRAGSLLSFKVPIPCHQWHGIKLCSRPDSSIAKATNMAALCSIRAAVIRCFPAMETVLQTISPFFQAPCLFCGIIKYQQLLISSSTSASKFHECNPNRQQPLLRQLRHSPLRPVPPSNPLQRLQQGLVTPRPTQGSTIVAVGIGPGCFPRNHGLGAYRIARDGEKKDPKERNRRSAGRHRGMRAIWGSCGFISKGQHLRV